MSINWHKYLKQCILTLVLALAIIVPTALATTQTPAPTPTLATLPPKDVNWNS